MRKIRVWGGEHPDELEAMVTADSLMSDSIPNVSSGIANPLARLLGKRFFCVNMANAYPGDRCSPFYELRRTPEILEQSKGFYATANIHNFSGHGGNMAAVDIGRGVSPIVLGFISNLGIRNLVLTDYGGIQRHARNAFALELDPNGLGGDLTKLREEFNDLANNPSPAVAGVDDFDWFKLIQPAHTSRLHPDDLAGETRNELFAFESLPAVIASKLAIEGKDARFVCWRDTPTPNGYWAEIVTPIATPDPVNWPNQFEYQD